MKRNHPVLTGSAAFRAKLVCMMHATRPLAERLSHFGLLLLLSGFAAVLASCASRPAAGPGPTSPAQARALIDRSLPGDVTDRAGWVTDLYDGLTELGIEPTREHICAVVAVTEQESGFHVDPLVPRLGAIAWREIDSRAEHAGLPLMVVHGVLQLKSPTGQTYSDRIDKARTEKELSDIFEDFTGSVPLGRTLFASWNPIRTRGPMQVNVAFAEKFAAAKTYPYPVKVSIADELFTRRGSLYFGIAHLLAYGAPYDQYLYRFADYNAGQYASRNAAFQTAVSIASGVPLVPDGALLPHDRDANSPGSTELAARALSGRLNIADSAIHDALEQARAESFEDTSLYKRAFVLAEKTTGHALPAAIVPRIKLQGPKIVRSLTTDWYAHRVDERFKRCLADR
ncbi:MAG TPA: DUF1615 domain-containing protein [Steroidobacteraceae bacterium]|nr:DUF1615 domain-containing protein [Steroidobacteraceae bacterium]